MHGSLFSTSMQAPPLGSPFLQIMGPTLIAEPDRGLVSRRLLQDAYEFAWGSFGVVITPLTTLHGCHRFGLNQQSRLLQARSSIRGFLAYCGRGSERLIFQGGSPALRWTNGAWPRVEDKMSRRPKWPHCVSMPGCAPLVPNSDR